jgi:hypothetical protein
MNVFPADARLAFTSSVIATALVSAFALALAIALFLLPLSLLTFLFFMGALGLLVVAIWLGYQAYQLRDVSYSLDRNALVIRWGTTVEVVPTGDIREVSEGSRIADRLRLWRLPLPGWWFGEGRHPTLGSVRAYATEPPERQLLIVTSQRSYLLSPNDMEGFFEALQVRLEMGPTRLVAPSRTLPAFACWRIWRDRPALVLLALGWALNLTHLRGEPGALSRIADPDCAALRRQRLPRSHGKQATVVRAHLLQPCHADYQHNGWFCNI